jgi:hypothetical protein
MRVWLRTHGGLATAILGVIATLLGGVAVLVPDLRGWFQAHPGTGWLISLIGVTLAIHLWITWDRAVEATKRAERDAAANLGAERSKHADQLTAKNQLVASKDAQIADLERRLHPISRDKALFNEVLEVLPWDHGTMVWLKTAFTAKRWTDHDTDTLFQFDVSWRERFMDDPEADEAFAALRSAIHDLTQWMAGEGAPDDYANRNRPADQPWVYSIADGSERPGGWTEFDKVRAAALALAQEVIIQRRNFEAVGRQRGL